MHLSHLLPVSVLVACAAFAPAQLATHDNAATAQNAAQPRRTRLILKDGSYQLVMSYKVAGSRVEYISAERGGAREEIPLELVDLPATKRWEQRHSAQADANGEAQRSAPVLDPELAREEADRATLTPEVAPDLRLVPQDSVLALDYWQGAPELVPLMQTEGDLNRQTGHSVLRGVIKPNSSRHTVAEIPREKAFAQMHVAQPEIFLRLDDASLPGGAAMTIDTGGASSSSAVKEARKEPSRYAIVRLDVRTGARVLGSFDTSSGESARHQDDVIATSTSTLPGGHWMKIVPNEPLLFGEYSLVEILGNDGINLSVWDFGVHPTAPENRDVLHPERRRLRELERRPSSPTGNLP